ncbi:DNA repair protein RecO [Myxococcota bacterium]|nr:DNA repair protein RecO [Myxococcota bacterium]
MNLRTRALVLRSVDFGESDRILHLLLPDSGRQSVIAKGARRSMKRFAGNLDYFNLLDVQIAQRRSTVMARLDQASLVRSWAPLRVSAARFALGCYLLEMLGRLAPEGGARTETRRLFELTLTAFDVIAARDPDARLRTLLELRLLEALGLRPELSRCVRCSRTSEDPTVGFCIAEGGPVCVGCQDSVRDELIKVHLGTLRALDRSLRFSPDQLDRLALGRSTLEEAGTLLARFRHFHVGLELKSEPFLDRALGTGGGAQKPI